jgi:hypothetical protein
MPLSESRKKKLIKAYEKPGKEDQGHKTCQNCYTILYHKNTWQKLLHAKIPIEYIYPINFNPGSSRIKSKLNKTASR